MKALIDNLDIKVNHFTKQAVIAALQMMILKTGFSPYKLSVIIANAVARALLGRGISVAGNAALTRAISVFAGPIGLALNAFWLAVDIAGGVRRRDRPHGKEHQQGEQQGQKNSFCKFHNGSF